MPAPDLEKTLRNLPLVGTLVKDRGYRQVWRFEQDGRAYYLKFYPTGGYRDRFRRFFRGSPAIWEFTRLQWLQKAAIPAPRAVAAMLGFRLGDRTGDVVISESIEPSVQLDQLLIDAQLRGEMIPAHRQLTQQVLSIVHQLGEAGLGHEDLHLGNFLLHDGKLFLLDGYAVRAGGLRMRDLLMLGHSARRFATTADIVRGWKQVGLGGHPPAVNSVSRMLQKRFMESITRSNRYFGQLSSSGWAGIYCKRTKYGHRWSRASQLEMSEADWATEWTILLGKMDRDELPVIKRTRSGCVMRATVRLNDQQLDVIVKRPRRRYWYRYVNEIGRGHRARRAWKKAWTLISLGLPTAWPVLLMEKRVAGYVVDAVIISEQVPGETLAHTDLDLISSEQREGLFRRTGHLLREIEKSGYSHFDSKASNWIVYHDQKLGAMPVMIDVDGIRHRNWVALGIQRLLKSMHENPHYTPPDSLALCRGYAPFAALGVIAPEPAPVTK